MRRSASADAPGPGDLLAAIEELAREKLEWEGRLEPEMRLVEDLGLDSLRNLALAIEIENRFKICLDEEDEGTIETVADLMAAVRRKLEERP